MASRRTSVSVYLDHAAIGRLTLPGGMVNKYVSDMASEVLTLALAEAPVRSGALKASLRKGGGSSNQYGTAERVYAGAGHAIYVLRGTVGPIVSPNGGFLYVGKDAGQPASTWTKTLSVAGQSPNNFLNDALKVVMTRHGI